MGSKAVLRAVVLLVFFLTIAMGCGKRGSGDLSPTLTGDEAPAELQIEDGQLAQELREALYAEFERLGIDPEKVSASAPQDDANKVFDLEGRVLPGGPPYTVELTWTERILGDYNQNGLVEVADLTPLGQRYEERTQYDPPSLRAGFEGWPSGDPDYDGESADSGPPVEGSGAWNWRLARIDGNSDGLIWLSDITTIAQHWQERLDGYRVYVRGPGEAIYGWVQPHDGGNLTVGRPSVDPLRPVRYSLPFEADLAGEYRFYVAPYDETKGEEGRESDETTVLVGGPVAVLNTEPASGRSPLTVMLDASDSYDTSPGGMLVLFEWDWDMTSGFETDHTTGALGFTECIYEAGGTYHAAVRVMDDDGSSDIAWTVIVVDGNQPPMADVTASPTSGPAPLAVAFDASGSADQEGEIAQYDWDWDGAGMWDLIDGGPTPMHTFEEDGVYNTTLRVWDTDGASDTVSLSDTVGGQIRVGFPPVAVLATPTPSTGDAPLAVSFDASQSSDPNGSIVKYEWDWEGDGTIDHDSGLDPTAEHTYEEPAAAPYLPTVRVTDDTALTDADSQEVTVGSLPTAAIAADPTTGFSPLTVQFDATGSEDPFGEVTTYDWDWQGDEVYDLLNGGPTPEHIYGDDGEYSASVRITDGDGNTDVDTILIIVSNTPPTAALVANPRLGFAPLELTLDASASSDTDGSVVSYQFDFGKGGGWETPISASEVQHTYTTPGDYTASVKVQDDDGTWADTPSVVPIHVNDPALEFNWHAVDAGGHWFSSMLLADDTLSVAFHNNESNTLELAQSTACVPSGSADWNVTQVDSDTGAGFGASIVFAGDHLGVFYSRHEAAETRIRFAHAKSSTPQQSDDWTIMDVDSLGYGIADFGAFIDGSTVNGIPAVSYWDTQSPMLKYAYATSPSPDSSFDWVLSDVETLSGTFPYCETSLAELGGKPAIAYTTPHDELSERDIRFARATTADPTGNHDWVIMTVDESDGYMTLGTSMIILNNRPAIAYTDETANVLRYAHATVPLPATSADWVRHVIDTGSAAHGPRYCSLKLIDGRPAIAYMTAQDSAVGEVLYARAKVTSPAAGTDWTIYSVDDSTCGWPNNLSLVSFYDVPAISYFQTYSADELRFATAK